MPLLSADRIRYPSGRVERTARNYAGARKQPYACLLACTCQSVIPCREGPSQLIQLPRCSSTHRHCACHVDVQIDAAPCKQHEKAQSGDSMAVPRNADLFCGLCHVIMTPMVGVPKSELTCTAKLP